MLAHHRPSVNSGLTWRIGTSIVVPGVAILSKIWTQLLNRTQVHHRDVFERTLSDHHRKRSAPLITICNHSSCLDDPLLWGALLPMKWTWNAFRHRWSAAAHDVCFTKQWHAAFFALGRSLPICRGAGVYQPSMEAFAQLIRDREFVHVFPQARVCQEDADLQQTADAIQQGHLAVNDLNLNDLEDVGKTYSLKWGLARMILDALDEQSVPYIQLLPFYHLGMDRVLPTQEPYIPRIGHSVTIVIRAAGPIRFDRSMVRTLTKSCQTINQRRQKVMQFLEYEMKLLKFEALTRHASLSVN